MKTLIKGGRVIDPANKIDKIADVLVEDGRIAALHGGPEETALAAALALVEPSPAAKAKPQPAAAQRQEPPPGSVELGRVEKDGRVTRYYRSPEGRVLAIEEVR